ncbi:hypothetical protein HPB50_023237 [Hyalomma asiaticum]|uniref:Uncharacterized protein n=1 Tax=Hyalomma asiaticum TaxID=266040 RepID=A0ACB7TS60_HYAAI|nr:hypothetical protein HPB50_023237 [Hyalomma asiaticum]
MLLKCPSSQEPGRRLTSARSHQLVGSGEIVLLFPANDAGAFHRRFRDTQKITGETFQEFAFNMKADLVKWLKGESVYTDRDKLVDLICLQ